MSRHQLPVIPNSSIETLMKNRFSENEHLKKRLKALSHTSSLGFESSVI